MAEKASATRPFGEEVRQLLADRNMTLRSLAAQVGVDPGFLVRVLQGKQPPSHKVIEGVSEAFGLPPDYFVEARWETLEGMIRPSPLLVATVYERFAPAERGISSGKLRPPDHHTHSPWADTLTILGRADVSDQRIARLGAAVVFRYQEDERFRRAVDEQLPAIGTLASQLASRWRQARDTERQTDTQDTSEKNVS
jgi:transcriptional regulator with XRE-family HTH domain